MANWTNANEAGKTSFVVQRESPLSRGNRGGWERVYVRETMRKQWAGGGGGGKFFMQVSRLQWADSPPKSLIKAHHLSSFSLLSLSPCSVLQSIHHQPLCATEQLTTL